MTDAHLLTLLERHEWTFAGGQCAVCFGLRPGPQWQFYETRRHASGARVRRYHEAELGHAPECDRALLMRDLGGTPVLRLQPPDPSKA